MTDKLLSQQVVTFLTTKVAANAVAEKTTGDKADKKDAPKKEKATAKTLKKEPAATDAKPRTTKNPLDGEDVDVIDEEE